MSVLQSAAVGLFCLSMVFFVLLALYAMVMALSRILRLREASPKEQEGTVLQQASEDWDVEAVPVSSGEVRLWNVDEKTAAMIMAIVSDESGIPLSELYFKSIRAVE